MKKTLDSSYPKLIRTQRTKISPWIEVIERDVQFDPSSDPETYYAISQPTFLVALVLTQERHVVLVRQYRPAIRRVSIELPAGLLERNENPETAIAREIVEETGYVCKSITKIGSAATCSSRIDNTTLSFFVEAGKQSRDFTNEPGIDVILVSFDELRELVLSGEFGEQTHLGVLALAQFRGLITL